VLRCSCLFDDASLATAAKQSAVDTGQARRLALRFLVQCIEDLHMPMHVRDNHDRGGNDTQVRFFDRATNMHRLWDSDLIAWNTSSKDL